MDSTCFWELPEACILIACRCPWVTDFLWAKDHGSLLLLSALQIKKRKKKEKAKAGADSLLELVKLFVWVVSCPPPRPKSRIAWKFKLPGPCRSELRFI